MQFSQVIGQQETKDRVISMIHNDRLPHALMLLGTEGSGKLPLALALTQFIFCHNPTESDSCGTCPNCNKISKFIHPDLHFSYPVVGTKIKSEDFIKEWRSALENNPYLSIDDWLEYLDAGNKQANINKDECSSILKNLSLKTYEGGWKVQIIWLPEYLGKEGNRLLKIIEEPPENTLFILLVENQEQVLNTILSRCQVIKLRPLLDEEVIEGLKSAKGALSENEIKQAAITSGGNYNVALKMADGHQGDFTVLFLDWLRKSYVGNGVKLQEPLMQIKALDKEKQKFFLHYALFFLREFLVLSFSSSAATKYSKEELKAAANLKALLDLEKVEEMAELISTAIYHLERNANAFLLFLNLSLKLHQVMRKSS